jgi:hypothetical protein
MLAAAVTISRACSEDASWAQRAQCRGNTAPASAVMAEAASGLRLNISLMMAGMPLTSGKNSSVYDMVSLAV